MARRHVNVLLLEDNPGDARLISEALSQVSSPKFKLTHVERLEEGLRRLDQEQFDVVVLDLLLEDSPRLGTLMEIHGQASKVPIVVLTGLEDPTIGLWGLSEARKRLATDRFDIVLLDLMLPDKPNMGSLIEIHDQASKVPIVVLTGLDEEVFAGWTFEEGAQDYLVKGKVDAESLVRCIRH